MALSVLDDNYDVPVVQTNPKRDIESRRVWITSVELSERHREANLLRESLSRLKAKYDALRDKNTANEEKLKRLSVSLCNGGISKAFEKLDVKYQALRRRHEEEEEINRGLVYSVQQKSQELDAAQAALELKLEDFNTNRQEWTDAAVVSQLLSKRDLAITTLKQQHSAAEAENADLAAQVGITQEENAELRALITARQDKISQLVEEIHTLGDSKDALVGTIEQSIAENTMLRQKAEALQAERDTATQAAQGTAAKLERAEAELRKLALHTEVAEQRLVQSRDKLTEAHAELEEERRRGSPKTLEEARASLHEATLRAETLVLQLGQAESSLDTEQQACSAARHEASTLRMEVDTLRAALSRAEAETAETTVQLRRQSDAEAQAVRFRSEVEGLEQERAVLRETVERLTLRCERVEGERKEARQRLRSREAELSQKRGEAERLSILSATRQELRRASQERPSPASPPTLPALSDASDPDLVANAFALATTHQPLSALAVRVNPVSPVQQHSLVVSDITRSPQSPEGRVGGGGGGAEGGGGSASRSPQERRSVGRRVRNQPITLEDIANYHPSGLS